MVKSSTISKNSSSVYTVVIDPHQYDDRVQSYPSLLKNSVGLSIFQFPHNVTSDKKIPQDEQLASTICSIVNDYARNQCEEVVILYHCDHIDGRQKARSRKFTKWFSDYNYHDFFKHELEIKLQKPNVYEGEGNPDLQSDGFYDFYYIGFITTAKESLEEIKEEFNLFAFELLKTEKPHTE